MPVSRREMLKRGLVMIGAAVGIAAVGSEVNPADEPLTLKGHGFTLEGRSKPRGALLDGGDRLLGRGELYDPSGSRVGDFYATFIGLESSGRVGMHAPTSLEWHTFALHEGSILGVGTGSRDLDAADTFAIVGGTGRYAGAQGTYVAIRRPFDLGGDGSAEFTMSFAAGGR